MWLMARKIVQPLQAHFDCMHFERASCLRNKKTGGGKMAFTVFMLQCKSCATTEERRRRESRPQLGPEMQKTSKKCTRYIWLPSLPLLGHFKTICFVSGMPVHALVYRMQRALQTGTCMHGCGCSVALTISELCRVGFMIRLSHSLLATPGWTCFHASLVVQMRPGEACQRLLPQQALVRRAILTVPHLCV